MRMLSELPSRIPNLHIRPFISALQNLFTSINLINQKKKWLKPFSRMICIVISSVSILPSLLDAIFSYSFSTVLHLSRIWPLFLLEYLCFYEIEVYLCGKASTLPPRDSHTGKSLHTFLFSREAGTGHGC